MRDSTRGLMAMIGASSIWGLSPIYYKALAHVPPLEVLSHRTLWSFVIFAAVLAFQGRFGVLRRALSTRRGLAVIAFAGAMISLNWFVFILSVQIGRAVEASLGYYIFPLVAVALGALFFGERLGRAQWVAVSLALVAVAVLTWGLGAAPWISLILATSFGLYGLVKKALDVGPVVSVTGEVALLLPLALVWLVGVNMFGWQGVTGRAGGFFGHDLTNTVMLMFSGVITAGPLILFSYATKRLSYASVGLIQYLNPSLQFLVATLVFAEPFTRWHAIAFALIWSALAIYSLAGWRASRAVARRGSSSATEAGVVK